jgi:hypothetical protein
MGDPSWEELERVDERAVVLVGPERRVPDGARLG